MTLLRQLGAVWETASTGGALAELLHSIYERIAVSREGLVEVTLTPHTYPGMYPGRGPERPLVESRELV